MQRMKSIVAPLALTLALGACGRPAAKGEKQSRLTAPVGDVSGCDQFGFAGTQAQTDWSTDCGIPGSNVVNADGVPTGQVLELKAFFNCRTYDQDTWDEVLEWDQCLNGQAHPSGGDAQISYDYPGCHYVDGVCGFAQLPDDPAWVDGTTPDGILLRVLIAHLNDARAQIKAQGGANIDQQMQLLDSAQLFADLSNEAFVNKARALGVQSVSVGMRIVDLAVNFVPGVSLARDSVIVLTGKNPITGETVTDVERAMIAGTLLVPAFLEGASRSLIEVGEAAEGVARSGRADAAAAGDLVAAIERADEDAVDLVRSVPCTASLLPTGKLKPLGKVPCGQLGLWTGELAAETETVLSDLRSGQVSLGTSTTNNYRNTFFNAYGWELTDDVEQVHHAIPQVVQQNWENLISDSEMNSLENLRGIAPGDTQLHQGQITGLWNDYLKSFKDNGLTPTREELLSYALEIDNQFGQYFVPPIR